MPAGLQIFNSYNTVQIDENYRNLSLKEKRDVTIAGDIYTTLIYDLVFYGEAAVAGVISRSLFAVPIFSEYSGGYWTQRWLFKPIGFMNVNEVVTFYIWDEVYSPSTNVGIEVFDGIGRRTFHSDSKPMKILGQSTANNSYWGDPSGRLILPILNRPSFQSEFGGSSYSLYSWFLRSNFYTIEANRFHLGQSFLEYTDYGLYTWVDITGY